jgi:hypothetical protein
MLVTMKFGFFFSEILLSKGRYSFLMPLQLKKNSNRINKNNYTRRLPFEKYKLLIAHKWVDGIKIICTLGFVVFLY